MVCIIEMAWAGRGYPWHETILHPSEDGTDPIRVTLHSYPGRDTRFYQLRDNAWEDFFELGLRHSWRPEGAYRIPEGAYKRNPIREFVHLPGISLIDSYRPWDWGSPTLITGADAYAWAEALELALWKLKHGILNYEFKTGPILLGESMTPDDYIQANRPTNQKLLRDFIDFLRKGPFLYAWDD
jgi:hypothetical protein